MHVPFIVCMTLSCINLCHVHGDEQCQCRTSQCMHANLYMHISIIFIGGLGTSNIGQNSFCLAGTGAAIIKVCI